MLSRYLASTLSLLVAVDSDLSNREHIDIVYEIIDGMYSVYQGATPYFRSLTV